MKFPRHLVNVLNTFSLYQYFVKNLSNIPFPDFGCRKKCILNCGCERKSVFT